MASSPPVAHGSPQPSGILRVREETRSERAFLLGGHSQNAEPAQFVLQISLPARPAHAKPGPLAPFSLSLKFIQRLTELVQEDLAFQQPLASQAAQPVDRRRQLCQFLLGRGRDTLLIAVALHDLPELLARLVALALVQVALAEPEVGLGDVAPIGRLVLDDLLIDLHCPVHVAGHVLLVGALLKQHGGTLRAHDAAERGRAGRYRHRQHRYQNQPCLLHRPALHVEHSSQTAASNKGKAYRANVRGMSRNGGFCVTVWGRARPCPARGRQHLPTGGSAGVPSASLRAGLARARRRGRRRYPWGAMQGSSQPRSSPSGRCGRTRRRPGRSPRGGGRSRR